MRELKVDSQYCSPFADLMAQFIQEGRSCGYRYETETRHLRQLDRFLCDTGLTSLELPKSVVESWTGKRPNDRPRTHQARISIVRRFGLVTVQPLLKILRDKSFCVCYRKVDECQQGTPAVAELGAINRLAARLVPPKVAPSAPRPVY